MKTFKQHLTEAFKLQPVDYGTNETLDDKGTESFLGGKSTFFEFNDMGYLVIITMTGEVIFGSSDTPSNATKDYDLSRASSSNPLKVLGSIMYVAGELIKSMPELDTIYFSGNDSGLDRLYNKIVKNKSFLDIMDKIGYEYTEKDGKNYVFNKKGYKEIERANRTAMKDAINPFT